MNRTEYIGKLNALYVGEKNCLEELITAYDEKDKEIEKLNNIINELEKWLDKKEKLTFNSWNKGIHEVQRKLQELKGNNNGVWVNNLLEVIKENNIEFGSNKE